MLWVYVKGRKNLCLVYDLILIYKSDLCGSLRRKALRKYFRVLAWNIMLLLDLIVSFTWRRIIIVELVLFCLFGRVELLLISWFNGWFTCHSLIFQSVLFDDLMEHFGASFAVLFVFIGRCFWTHHFRSTFVELLVVILIIWCHKEVVKDGRFAFRWLLRVIFSLGPNFLDWNRFCLVQFEDFLGGSDHFERASLISYIRVLKTAPAWRMFKYLLRFDGNKFALAILLIRKLTALQIWHSSRHDGRHFSFCLWNVASTRLILHLCVQSCSRIFLSQTCTNYSSFLAHCSRKLGRFNFVCLLWRLQTGRFWSFWQSYGP